MLATATPMGFIAVRDFAAAQAFYVGVLGLAFVVNDGFALVLRSGNLIMRLAQVKDLNPQPFTVFGWQVDDMDGKVAALTAHGIAFERYAFMGDAQNAAGIWTAPTGDKVAWFKDPDGNLLSLSQHVA